MQERAGRDFSWDLLEGEAVVDGIWCLVGIGRKHGS